VHCKGTGCYACMKRGFIKRIAIFELNHYDSEKKHMIRIGKSIKDTLEVLYQNNEISLHTLENYS
jgi:type II secretory ATPase GspE/PulE/Tfp pilus assembly ATPase PilB-like protein